MLVGKPKPILSRSRPFVGKTQNLLEGVRFLLAHLVPSLLQTLIESTGEVQGDKVNPGFPGPSMSSWILLDSNVLYIRFIVIL
jgi:hypothetical protein